MDEAQQIASEHGHREQGRDRQRDNPAGRFGERLRQLMCLPLPVQPDDVWGERVGEDLLDALQLAHDHRTGPIEAGRGRAHPEHAQHDDVDVGDKALQRHVQVLRQRKGQHLAVDLKLTERLRERCPGQLSAVNPQGHAPDKGLRRYVRHGQTLCAGKKEPPPDRHREQ